MNRPAYEDTVAKVPAVTLGFWIIKILCTTVGESAADYINTTLGLGLLKRVIAGDPALRSRLVAAYLIETVAPADTLARLLLVDPGGLHPLELVGVDRAAAAGVAAAIQLACEIYKGCNGEECRLPAGAQRINRQGITIEKVPFTQWGWTTGKRAGQISIVEPVMQSQHSHIAPE